MNHLTFVSDDAAAELCSGDATLFLPRLQRLTSAPLATRLLTRMELGGSDLRFIEEISPEAAAELAKHTKQLRLFALKSLNAEIAAALASHRADIDLPALEHIDRETGDALAGHPGGIHLPKLRNLLSAALAKKLIKDGERQFQHIQEISPEVAKVFADHDFDFSHRIDLSGLTALSVEAARSLVDAEADLALNGLTEMPLPLAQVLGRFAGARLELKGVHSMSKQSQEALGSIKGQVVLAPQDVVSSRSSALMGQVHSAKAITSEVAAALAKRDDELTLSVTELPPDVAEALSDYVGDTLRLNSIRTLSLESARHLGKLRLRRLEMNALDELPASVATLLAPLGPSHALELKGLRTLDKDTAAILAQSVAEVDLSGVKSLDPAAATALAAKGDKPRQFGLDLEGLCDLSPEAARGLARYRGDLRLPSIKTITPEVAEAFASHKGKLMLGITSIDDESVEWLSKHRDEVNIFASSAESVGERRLG
ncbi:MAG: hypothetical protein K8S94_01815 [Planctomycetia bacterium]|nr:hypothetical protein [Planctomycetia bacterium]